MLGSLLLAASDAASSTPKEGNLAQLLLYFGGGAGLVSALVALLKLKPDANSQSVTQAQGAATEWRQIAADRKTDLEQCESQLEKWRDRALSAEEILRQHGIPVPPRHSSA